MKLSIAGHRNESFEILTEKKLPETKLEFGTTKSFFRDGFRTNFDRKNEILKVLFTWGHETLWSSRRTGSGTSSGTGFGVPALPHLVAVVLVLDVAAAPDDALVAPN